MTTCDFSSEGCRLAAELLSSAMLTLTSGPRARRPDLWIAGGHELLASAGLAADQQRDVEVGDPPDVIAQAADVIAVADHAEVADVALGVRGEQVQQQRARIARG